MALYCLWLLVENHVGEMSPLTFTLGFTHPHWHHMAWSTVVSAICRCFLFWVNNVIVPYFKNSAARKQLFQVRAGLVACSKNVYIRQSFAFNLQSIINRRHLWKSLRLQFVCVYVDFFVWFKTCLCCKSIHKHNMESMLCLYMSIL